MRVTIEKKTDQLNFEDFLGGVTRIVTIAGVKKGTKEQQYDIAIEGDNRFWRPAVTVLKQLVEAWGDNATQWVGRRAELYGDPDVRFGSEKVGGIRVSRLSHIDKPLSVRLTITRGKRGTFTVDPLPDTPPPASEPSLSDRITQAVSAFAGVGVTVEQIESKLGGRKSDAWTDADLSELLIIYRAIGDSVTTIEAEFGGEQA